MANRLANPDGSYYISAASPVYENTGDEGLQKNRPKSKLARSRFRPAEKPPTETGSVQRARCCSPIGLLCILAACQTPPFWVRLMVPWLLI